MLSHRFPQRIPVFPWHHKFRLQNWKPFRSALLAGLVGPALSTQVVTEMSAVGGTILVGMAVNMLGLGRERIKVANMLPAIFVPIAYFPVAAWITGLFS